MPADVICIAASHVTPSLRDRLTHEGEVQAFADTEPIQALQAILDRRPRLIVLERLFAATPRGAALINRIKTDPQLGHAEVRVMSHTGDYMRQVVRPATAGTGTLGATSAAATNEAARVAANAPAAGPAAVQEPPRSLDWHGTRRAPRHRVRPGLELQLDGNPASIVDVSLVGAQVLSSTVLRPNQKVRVSIPAEDTVLRFRGSIAWAKFELPRPPMTAPHYRAGVEFLDADAVAMDDFCARHRS